MAGHVFTDDEIKQIIDVINATKHTQYIGQRYVPIFGRNGETSIEWDNSAPYEPLTIVLHVGNSYTSRQYVPAGVDINDQKYWANTGNYNAQVEQYRQETAEAKKAADNAMSLATTNKTDIASIGADLTVIKERLSSTNIINFADYKDNGANDDERLAHILGLPDIAGKTLYFPSGKYTFKSSHTLPECFRIAGADRDSTVIVWDSTDDGDTGSAPFVIASGDGFEISNLSFTSPRALPTIDTASTPRYNFYLVMVAQNAVKNIYIHDINVQKYLLVQCGIPHISTNSPNENVTVANIVGGAWTNKNESQHDITSAVVEIYNTNNFRITGCNLYNKNYWGGGCGVQCWGGSSIDPETFRGFGTWLKRFSIDNNIIGHTQWSPIYTACAADGYICNNVVYDSSDGNMSIEGARNVVIANNILMDGNNYNIALANALDNVVFCDNSLSQSGEIGRIGDQSPAAQTPHRRYRFINRWGLRVNEDTSLHQSLVVANNVFRYDGDTASTKDGQCCGVIELGIDCGTLSFVDNHLTNVMLSTFTKPITGEWGIASSYQLAYLRPGRVRIRGNSFVFDDADMRVAQDNTPFQNACIYVCPAIGEPVVIENNEIKSINYAEKAVPITTRGIYVARENGNENYELDKKINKSIFIVRDNVFIRFDKILNAKNDSGVNDLDIILNENLYQTSDEWQIVKGGEHTTNIFFDNNRKEVYNKSNGEISWVAPLVESLPKKDSDLYNMTAVGTDFTFFGAQELGGKQYHTITRVSEGWRGCGEIGPVVTEW